MHIGIDFDNTIVCYDQIFHEAAVERDLIQPSLPASKQVVRDALRRNGKEDAWTELQGYVYGVKLANAAAYPGAIEFITELSVDSIPVSIISHKTRTPYAGPEYDLHRAARNWLTEHLPLQAVVDGATFEETKQNKLSRISELGCTHFIDDLPEFLTETSFPQDVDRILFDPENIKTDDPNFTRTRSWKEIAIRVRGSVQ